MKAHLSSVRNLFLTAACALVLAAPLGAQETETESVPPETAHPAPEQNVRPSEKPSTEQMKETGAEKPAKPEQDTEAGEAPPPDVKTDREPLKAEEAEGVEDAEEAESDPVDKEAVKAAVEMSKRLAELKNFSIRSEMSWEEVLDNGEKIISVEQVNADVQPPHGLRMERMSPGRERILFYNGKEAVLWGPVTRYYTTIAFDGSIAELAVHLADKYAYELPLADLFLWGHEKSDVDKLKAANFIGEDRIGDRTCNHYAFRQENVDWQIWIDTAEGGLPCRYAITDLTDPARPLFQAIVKIVPDEEFFDNRFTFSAPKDAAKIPIATAEEMKKQKEEQGGSQESEQEQEQEQKPTPKPQHKQEQNQEQQQGQE